MNQQQSHHITASVERARRGDQAAFADLARQFHAAVWRFLLKWVRSPHDAEELAQETFVLAWRNLARFRNESAFSTWLLGIALNLARNHHNRSPARREVELPDDDVLESLLPQQDDPAELLERKQRLTALDRAIGELSPELRETLILVRLEGLSLEEAAAMLAVPLGTVKSRLSRARERLTDAMAGLPV